MSKHYDVIVVGGGPAGMIASARAAECSKKVLLLERNNVLGVKLRITGNGRCNLTNTAALNRFDEYYVDNPKFLRNAFHKFYNQDLINLLARLSLKTKVESNGRVFPQSDKASDVVEALKNYLDRYKVKIKCRTLITDIIVSKDRIQGVKTEKGEILYACKIIIATGGKSYPHLGSNGSGYQWAKKAGHDLVACRPGLTGIEIKERWIDKLQGISINADIYLHIEGKKKKKLKGDIIFSHYGISGPAAFDMSMYIDSHHASLYLDLIPGYTHEQAIEEINKLIQITPKLKCKNMRLFNIPKKVVSICLDIANINKEKTQNSLTKKEKRGLIDVLKRVQLTIKRLRPLKESMVTRGGVGVKDINPKTMESNIVKGLYFCGEVLNIAGLSGGFNLQAAFSTGYTAGENAAGLTLQ